MLSVLVASAIDNDYRLTGTYTEISIKDNVTQFSCVASADECYRGPSIGPHTSGHEIRINNNGTIIEATLQSVTNDPSGSEDGTTYEAIVVEE